MEPLATARGVTRDFGTVRALDAVDVDVLPGSFVGLLGPNGAGKTTLLSLMTGLRKPTSGTVRLFSGDPSTPRSRRRLGVTPQDTGLPETLRVREVLAFVARHFPAPMPTDDLLGQFGLGDCANKQTGALSGGQKRRLTVALAFVGRPDLVVLDEPTTGLDVESRHALWQALRDYHQDGGTVLLTSHYLDEVDALADRVVVVDRGRLLTDAAPSVIKARVAVRTVTLRAETIPELDHVTHSERDGDRITLLTRDSDQLVVDLVRSGTPFHDLEINATSLEDAFISLTADRQGIPS